MKSKISIVALIVLGVALLANAQTIEKKTLTIDGAKKVIAGAVAYARKNSAPGGVIAVVDEGGNLMALERLDGTFAAGANISIGKARTAVLFRRPTKAFEDIIKNGRTAMVALPDAYFTPLQGGVPITIDGQIVGGIGVSGASSAQQDEELALAGANVFAEPKASDAMPSSTPPVLFFDAKQVSASFSVPLDASDRNYMVQLPTKQVLTLETARKIAAAAEAEAKKRGATVVIAVVDDGGYLLVLERLDDTQVASVEVGIAKARTAAIFRRPSAVFEDQVKNGRIAALALPGAVALQGGVPIIVNGKVIGAIGVSGNSPQEDEDIAKAGADSAVAAIKGGSK
jgi:glc operon protein GlcG